MKSLKETFCDRVMFVGLQGSYARGEATEASDIDIVLVLDELSFGDIEAYNSILDTLPHRELICGFLAGKNEIVNWDTSDLFQFCYDTTAIYGSIDDLFALIDVSAAKRAIKIGACNIYHTCVHNMLHEKSEKILRETYKYASFVMRAIAFKQTGKFFSSQKELRKAVSKEEQIIIDTFLNLKNGGAVDFKSMSEELFAWSKKWICEDD